MRNQNDGLPQLVNETLTRHRSRREVVQRAAALGLAAPLVAATLTQQRQGTATAAQNATPAAPPSGEPITIGAAVSTTGSNGRTGLYQQEAYLLWEEQKNASGGLLGRPVRMVLYDDQSDPATGARLYERLLTEDQVNLILGPYSSSVTQAVAQVTERAGQPMLAAGASASDIWARGYQYVFGVYSVAEDYFKSVILDIAPAQGYTTAAIIYEDTLFPTSTANGAAAHCETAGIEVVVNEVYPAEATDVSSVLTRVRDATPDMLIGGSYLPDSVLITRQSKELGVNPKLFAFSVGAAQPDFVESLGAHADYVLGPSMWEPQIETLGNAEFVAAYQAKFNREPDYHSAAGYSACQVLEAAVTQVGGLELDAIRDALRAVQMQTVLPGQYQVDEAGKQIGHIALTVQWQDGEKLIVTPEDFAEGELRLPTPPWNERG
ncbi:MAG TPA: amino acid ABC transporter substrate-binding protein [Thermomicrobiales bacterium]|nr:amino acid ABC transporter substrate-binding protein [Thermomicrobiales bacterium]